MTDLGPSSSTESCFDDVASPFGTSAFGNVDFQTAAPLSDSPVSDDSDAAVLRLNSKDAAPEVSKETLIAGYDDEPLPGKRVARWTGLRFPRRSAIARRRPRLIGTASCGLILWCGETHGNNRHQHPARECGPIVISCPPAGRNAQGDRRERGDGKGQEHQPGRSHFPPLRPRASSAAIRNISWRFEYSNVGRCDYECEARPDQSVCLRSVRQVGSR